MKFYKGITIGLALSLIFWLLLIGSIYAQPIAKITGPSQVPIGELTALSSTGSAGDNLEWIRPEGLTTILAGCEVMDSQIFFSTMKEGKYEFILVCTDKEARIAYTKHSVVVGKATTPPPVDPPPVDPPGPTPGKWSEMVNLSKTNADLVNDPITRPKLKQALNDTLTSIKNRCAAGQCPGLAQAQQEVTVTMENILLLRPDRFTKWGEVWRVPNSQYIRQKGIQDVPDYLEAVKAFAAGL